MVTDESKEEEEFENGLIDPKTIELDTKFREAIDGQRSIKGSLSIIWESMNYNFGKIRVTQHMNVQAIQKVALEQKIIESKLQEVSVKQSAFQPIVKKHMNTEEKEKIKTEATWGAFKTILGGTGVLITISLALLQLVYIIGGL